MLSIGYSGSLNSFAPKKGMNVISRFINNYFWTYRNSNIDSSTRSGYFLIQAVKLLNEKGLIQPGELVISLWGDIHPGNASQVDENKVGAYFSIEGYLPKEESLKKLACSDLLFLPLEKSAIPGSKTLYIPGKLFEYLNTGKPILALCESSDCKDILLASGMSICIEPDDVESIANTILDLVRNKEKLETYRPDINYIESLSFRNKTRELAGIFDHLMETKVR